MCGKTLSGILLCYIASSLLLRVLTTSLVSHLCSWGMWCLRHVGCVLIRGGHSVTGAGECGDEGAISSLGDR